jgi:UDP-glucose 4-epimerase
VALNKERILISGSRGGLACEFSRLLCNDYNLVGIDPRKPTRDQHFFGEVHRTHYRSRKVDDLFRQNKFKAFYHLGRISVTSGMHRDDRFSENVLGTQHLLELCREYNVPLIVVLSTFHVYGAHPHNHLYIKESDPLRATQTIPELSDALELDHLATQFALSFSGTTVVLRPTNIVGPKVSNSLTKMLRLKTIPTPMGYDPLFQVVHQDDMIRALMNILKFPARGIFNLAAPDVLPLSEALKSKEVERMPIPDLLLRTFLKIAPLETFKVPNYMVDFFKYPCILDTEEFKKKYNFEYTHNLLEALQNI